MTTDYQATFTPIQQKIMDILVDGMPHTLDELLKVFDDTEATSDNLRPHITGIRIRIRPVGQTIACERMDGVTYYRHARMIVQEK